MIILIMDKVLQQDMPECRTVLLSYFTRSGLSYCRYRVVMRFKFAQKCLRANAPSLSLRPPYLYSCKVAPRPPCFISIVSVGSGVGVVPLRVILPKCLHTAYKNCVKIAQGPISELGPLNCKRPLSVFYLGVRSKDQSLALSTSKGEQK